MEQHSTTHSDRPQEHHEPRSTDDIKRDIERRRASIARTVDQAGQKLHQSVDWREQMREHPYGALALAALAGLAVAGLARRQTTRAEQLAMLLTGTALPRPGLGRGLRAAVTAFATQSAMNAVRRRIAGVASESTQHSTDDQSTEERTW
jgi:Flp pilus assembly protein TadB